MDILKPATTLSKSFLLLLAVMPALLFADDAAEQLVLATYKLANESSTATCLVVSREGEKGARYIVTANHVLAQMRGDSCNLISRTAQKNETYKRDKIQVTIRRDGEDLWEKHPDYDLAVLRLPDSVEVNTLPFDSLASEAELKEMHTGDTVHLAVFPEKTEANGAGFPILRMGTIASYPIMPIKQHSRFLVDTTTWGGDSGGPVVHKSLRSRNGGPLVLGIVLAQKNITDTERESRFVERKTNYPLGISEVLHAVFARDLIEKP